ncbi:daptide biosynthesis intramembrane metalloprotease [Trueperella abortisuis]|uniref:daptide biosynthesis intramembrane metalloprotease n=1 Tax=Trueperella abortisuis TaxID=445930 RepID=UPI002892F5F3|nr:daptide biosynthesis intramembrane metalloprotease [Trueperella abortisuis]
MKNEESNGSWATANPPRISDTVVLHEPHHNDESWILQSGSRRYIRIQAELARLIQSLTGEHSVEELSRSLGGVWTPANIEAALEKLQDMNLLFTEEPKRKNRRFRMEGLHRIQFTLLETPQLFEKLRPFARLVVSKPSQIVWATICVVGFLALGGSFQTLLDGVAAPVDFRTYLVVGLASLSIMFLHEFAHGLILTGFGGTPNSVGVMLLYFTPAFYCDISDGWRLRNNSRRVAVALAGIIFQLGVAGISCIIALFPISNEVSKGLLLFATLNYVSCVVNALPFIKLDGYLALMTYLDRPFLRENSMKLARSWLSRVFFGVRRPQTDVEPKVLLFGLLSMIVPVVIVATLVVSLSESIKGLGVIANWGALFVVAGFVVFIGRAISRLYKNSRNDGISPIRTLVSGVVTLASLIVGGFLVPVPQHIQAGYVVSGDELYLVSITPIEDVLSGRAVVIRSRGLVTSVDQGSAQIISCGETLTAPLHAIVPIKVDSLELPVYGCAMKHSAGYLENAGAATVLNPPISAWQWLGQKLPVYGSHGH